MANVLKKTPDANGVYHYVENILVPGDYPSGSWEYDPDTSALTGSPAVNRNYWKYVSDNDAKCGEMNQSEKDAVDLALAGLPVEEGQVYTECYTYAADEERTIILPAPLRNVVVHVLDPNVQELIGGSLDSPKGTGYDPGNVSTGELNINNGNCSDLVYNNSSNGNTTWLVYAIDMGSATTVTAMTRCDYSASYYDTEWQFIGFDAPLAGSPFTSRFSSGYDVIFTQTQSSANLSANPFIRAFPGETYRYFGVRCVTSFNASYSIISEMGLYTGGTVQTVEKKLSVNTDYECSWLSPTQISIKNITGESKELKTVVMGAT